MHRPISSEPVIAETPLLPPPAEPRRRRPRVPAWLILALITVAGGAIRFTHLDRPCLWGDEALVYWRTCGTYDEMLTPLRSVQNTAVTAATAATTGTRAPSYRARPWKTSSTRCRSRES